MPYQSTNYSHFWNARAACGSAISWPFLWPTRMGSESPNSLQSSEMTFETAILQCPDSRGLYVLCSRLFRTKTRSSMNEKKCLISREIWQEIKDCFRSLGGSLDESLNVMELRRGFRDTSVIRTH